jgi:hypothetical protein
VDRARSPSRHQTRARVELGRAGSAPHPPPTHPPSPLPLSSSPTARFGAGRAVSGAGPGPGRTAGWTGHGLLREAAAMSALTRLARALPARPGPVSAARATRTRTRTCAGPHARPPPPDMAPLMVMVRHNHGQCDIIMTRRTRHNHAARHVARRKGRAPAEMRGGSARARDIKTGDESERSKGGGVGWEGGGWEGARSQASDPSRCG